MAVQQPDRRVGIVEQVELAVGLVDDHADVAQDLREEGLDVPQGERGRGRVVRVADDDEARRRRDLRGHAVELVAVVVVERDADRGGAGRCRQVRIDGEARPGVDDLGAGLEQGLAGGEEDVAGAVADGDALARDAVADGQAAAQPPPGRVRDAVAGGERAQGRREDLGQRRVGRFVGGQQRDVLGQRVAVGGRVDRDLAQPGGELDGHWAWSRSARSVRAFSRYTCSGWWPSSA